MLGVVALVWGNLRGQPNVWHLGGQEPVLSMTFAGISCGLTAGLALVFASRMALYRFNGRASSTVSCGTCCSR